MSTEDRLIQVGTFGGTFGIKGFIKVHTTGDSLLNIKLPALFEVRLSAGETKKLNIQTITQNGNTLIAKLEGYDTPEAVAIYRNASILLPKNQLPKIDPSEIYVIDLVGLQAVKELGGEPYNYTIVEVLDNPAHPILRLVPKNDGLLPAEILVPFLELYVGKWDISKKEIEMRSWELWFEV